MKRFVISLALLAGCTTTTRQAEPPTQQTSAPAPTPEAPPPAKAEAPQQPSSIYVFQGVEVFGSRKIPKEKLLELITLPAPGTELDVQNEKQQKEFVANLMESKKRLTDTGAFAFIRMSVGQDQKHRMSVTVDLVDNGDEWRMAFNPEPKGEVADPEGLLAAWSDYLKTFWKLRNEGAVPEWGMGTCRAPMGCYGGFDHPELAPLEQRFIDGVPRNVDALVRVLREDKDSGKRMNALMLLTYLSSPEQMAKAVLPSVRDPDQGVRNEALRRLGSAQEVSKKPGIVPIEPVLEALWYPLASDRNKAGWTLVHIMEVEGTAHRQQILDKAGEVLVEMASMRSDIDHEPARKVLAQLAGKDFGNDVAAWRRWFEQARSPRP
ncbi:HEAT repeat domain-containing protein [Archangium lansingense]|uniref:HEAT repeat domain-containing protein n=1 Tax=Archangium lansingense TaxID=2995310 RepID=A0ABT4A9A2_9BACT|nr:HEAT repeat domain-containing protein [Archangium lansinium]MCY1078233.1 HEAT repeat domain-containing protein [Archangium lansinium]